MVKNDTLVTLDLCKCAMYWNILHARTHIYIYKESMY